jgi:metal-sulfur cluster biosynthetic enzyme
LRPGEPQVITRDCDTTQIPSGIPYRIPAGTSVRLMQSLGGSYTVMTLGLTSETQPEAANQEFSDKLVWDLLRTVYDPEIPVNVVDLGLIYDCQITPMEEGNQISIKMTMTAPGCGMADVLKSDIQRRLAGLPSVKAVNVDVVFDPPWNPTRMSEGARLQLGLDLDPQSLPMYGR